MRVSILLVLCLLAPAVLCSKFFSEEQLQVLFTKWMTQHEKSYSIEQFFQRFNIFKANVDFIYHHNAGNHTFTLAVNKFADLTVEEFRSQGHGLIKTTLKEEEKNYDGPHLNVKQPLASVDWRQQNAVTAVKDQGSCGSCWSFSTSGAVEGAHAIATKQLVSLTEQELIDCATSGNYGCNGGVPIYAMAWIISNRITTEALYPYKGVQGSCKSPLPAPAAGIKSYTMITTEAQLLSAVNIGPVSVCIEADTSYFQFYSSGVFSDTRCGTNIDHAVLVVGYGTATTGGDYWIVKNSWGPYWGSQGYILLKRNINLCGITSQMSYPTGGF